MRHNYAIICALIFILSSTPGWSVERRILDNGLTLIYKQNRVSRITSCIAFIRGGSCTEKADKSGITNLLLKTLLKGTTSLNAEEISRKIESLGGEIQSEVSPDFAQVSLVIPTRHFKNGFKIFADVMKNPAFLQDEIEKERKVVISEIRARYDEIFPYTYDCFLAALYDTFPYSRNVLGRENTVLSITRDDLAEYHRRLFAPNNIILVILTGMPLKEIIREVDTEFGSLLPFDRIQEKIEGPFPPEKPVVFRAEKEFIQGYLMFGYLAPEVSSEDYPVLKLINSILGEGGSSRLFVQIREKKGLAYEVGSFYPSRMHPSHFTIYMGLDSKKIEEAKVALQNLLETEPAEEEIVNAKSFLIGKFILDHESSQRQAWYLGWYEALGIGYRYDEEYPFKIGKINIEDVKRAISTYFRKDNWVCVEVRPPVNK